MKSNISKYLSYILRHKPDSIGLKLDKNGWADLDELILKTAEFNLSKQIIQEVVVNSHKKRFDILDNKIRANQGHSIGIDLDLEPVIPPNVLYHGTATRFLTSILEHGIMSKDRDYVHLSDSKYMAIETGKRHGKPYLITINSQKMYKDRYEFFLTKNGVWLTKYVPIKYIQAEDKDV